MFVLSIREHRNCEFLVESLHVFIKKIDESRQVGPVSFVPNCKVVQLRSQDHATLRASGMTPPALSAVFVKRWQRRGSIAISYRRFSVRPLNTSLRVWSVISHDSFPQNPIEQIRIVEVGVFEVEAFGRLRPPRTVV